MTRKMKSFREVEDEDTDGCECCMQWSLLVVNLPVLLMGAAMIIISVYNFAERSYLDELHLQSSALYSALSVTMLIAGLILMVLAVLGCVSVSMYWRVHTYFFLFRLRLSSRTKESF